MLNRTIIQLKLLEDPQMFYTKEGDIPLCYFHGLWTRKESKRTLHLKIHCSVWKECGEAFYRQFHKGDVVLVEGNLITKNWESKTGEPRSRIEMNVVDYHYSEKPKDFLTERASE